MQLCSSVVTQKWFKIRAKLPLIQKQDQRFQAISQLRNIDLKKELWKMFLKEARPMKQYTRAFVLIQVESMKERQVMEDLLKMEEVIEAHMITGEYDVIAVVQVKRMFLEADYDNVFNSAIAKIEEIKGVVDTNTVIGMASKTKISES